MAVCSESEPEGMQKNEIPPDFSRNRCFLVRNLFWNPFLCARTEQKKIGRVIWGEFLVTLSSGVNNGVVTNFLALKIVFAKQLNYARISLCILFSETKLKNSKHVRKRKKKEFSHYHKNIFKKDCL